MKPKEEYTYGVTKDFIYDQYQYEGAVIDGQFVPYD